MKKYIPTILISLLSISLLWNILFWLPDVHVEIAHIIHSNIITRTLSRAYDDFFSSSLCTVFAFINLVYSVVIKLKEMHQPIAPEVKTIRYWSYPLFSAVVFIIHLLSFNYIFSCLIAG